MVIGKAVLQPLSLGEINFLPVAFSTSHSWGDRKVVGSRDGNMVDLGAFLFQREETIGIQGRVGPLARACFFYHGPKG